jgi:hypothetical protein
MGVKGWFFNKSQQCNEGLRFVSSTANKAAMGWLSAFP